MIDEITVIDNIITDEECDIIYDAIAKQKIPFYFSRKIVEENHDSVRPQMYDDHTIIDSPWMFTEGVVRFENIHSVLNKVGKPLINKLMELLPDYTLMRFRGIVYFPIPGTNVDSHYIKHHDSNIPGMINGVFYICDSDGDTFLFPNRGVFYDSRPDDIAERVSPKKGRIVLFPDLMPHCGSPPLNTKYRMVINVNLVPNSLIEKKTAEVREKKIIVG